MTVTVGFLADIATDPDALTDFVLGAGPEDPEEPDDGAPMEPTVFVVRASS
jgi:hypothetical protein